MVHRGRCGILAALWRERDTKADLSQKLLCSYQFLPRKLIDLPRQAEAEDLDDNTSINLNTANRGDRGRRQTTCDAGMQNGRLKFW